MPIDMYSCYIFDHFTKSNIYECLMCTYLFIRILVDKWTQIIETSCSKRRRRNHTERPSTQNRALPNWLRTETERTHCVGTCQHRKTCRLPRRTETSSLPCDVYPQPQLYHSTCALTKSTNKFTCAAQHNIVYDFSKCLLYIVHEFSFPHLRCVSRARA